MDPEHFHAGTVALVTSHALEAVREVLGDIEREFVKELRRNPASVGVGFQINALDRVRTELNLIEQRVRSKNG